jgi:SulP family sulfate permease
MLIALAVAMIAVSAFKTIGTRFGDLPRTLPAPSLPDISLARIRALLPDAIAFALLGAIESLLSAVVADGMTGRCHRSNCELVGQGFANIASAFFGGTCVTGTIAWTATNVRSGAHGPIAGMRFIITGTSQRHRKLLSAAGVRPPDAEFADSIDMAMEVLRKTSRSA